MNGKRERRTVEAPEAVEMPEKHESGVVAVASTWVDLENETA